MLAFLIAATLQVGAGSTAEFPVTFRQDDARWPVVVNATGVVTQDGDGLRVRLGSVQVADQPANPSTIPYTTYRVCLAEGDREFRGGTRGHLQCRSDQERQHAYPPQG